MRVGERQSRQDRTHLAEFLQTKRANEEANSRIAITSHATLVRTFREHAELFKHVMLVIDEGHHTQCAPEDANGLGELIALAVRERNVSAGLSTATFFRGDRSANTILTEEMDRLFTHFHLPYDRYLSECQYLEVFHLAYVLYQADDWTGPLRDKYNPDEPTLIYIPTTRASESLGSKDKNINAVLRAISGCDEPAIRFRHGLMMEVLRGDRWLNVVNLVPDDQSRPLKKDLINQSHDSNQNDIDVVITLGLMKEAVNWKWAKNALVIGHRGSLTEIPQILGRILRDVPGKPCVKMLQFIPHPFSLAGQVVEDELNNYTKALAGIMMLYEMIPDSLSSDAAEPERSQTKNGNGERERFSRNTLQELIPEATARLNIMQDIRNQIIRETEGTGAMKRPAEVIVSDVLHKHHFSVDIAPALVRHIVAQDQQLLRMTKNLNVRDIDLSLLHNHPLPGLLTHVADLSGGSFAHAREAFERSPLTRPHWTDQEIVDAYEQNRKNILLTAKELGIAGLTVTYALKRKQYKQIGRHWVANTFNDNWFKQWYEQSKDLSKIAKECGLSVLKVRQRIDALGILRPRSKQGKIERHKEIMMLYREVGNVKAVAKKLNLDTVTIYNVLGKHGTVYRIPDGSVHADRIVAETNKGKKARVIADELGITVSVVRGIQHSRRHLLLKKRNRDTPTVILQEIRRLAQEGLSKNAIADRLNAEGHRTAHGAMWSYMAVYQLLRKNTSSASAG